MKAETDIELPRDPPSDASPLGLAMHYGNWLMLECLRRELPRETVLRAVLWYAAAFASTETATTDTLVEEFRTILERIRSGPGVN